MSKFNDAEFGCHFAKWRVVDPKRTKFAKTFESGHVQTCSVAVQEFGTCPVAIQEDKSFLFMGPLAHDMCLPTLDP